MDAENTLRKLQLAELEILKELDRVCTENSITYVIDAGTCLGAIRHGGFIPWDDDIDVRMSRVEYDKFCEICKTKLNSEKFFLQTYKTDPGYRWGFARILLNGTSYERANQKGSTYRTGIFLDVFPCDPYPEDGIERWYARRVSWLARKGLYSTVGKEVVKKPLNRVGFKILSLFPKKTYTGMLEYLSRRYRGYKTSLVRCYGWSEPQEEIGFDRIWFRKTKRTIFEGVEVSTPEDTHGFMVRSFGKDYMTPPPEHKRIQRHEATRIKFVGE